MRVPSKWWSDYPAVDLAVPVVAGVCAFFLFHLPPSLAGSDRSDLYASAGQVVAITAGLSAVAISVQMGMQGRGGDFIQVAAGGALRRNWVAVLVFGFVSALSCWGAQVVDLFHGPRWSWSVVVGAVALALMTTVRAAWLFGWLLKISAADHTISPQKSQKAVGLSEDPGSMDFEDALGPESGDGVAPAEPPYVAQHGGGGNTFTPRERLKA